MDMNYYQMLGVSQDASKDDINKAYRSLIAKYHPDIKGEAGEAATEYLNTIHDTLTDDYKRKEYDRTLNDDTNHAEEHHEEPRPHGSSMPHAHRQSEGGDEAETGESSPQRPAREQPIRRQQPALDPNDVKTPWSIKYAVASLVSVLVFPLSSMLIGNRISRLIPANPITSLIPSYTWIQPLVEIACIAGLGYLMVMYHTRMMHLLIAYLGAPLTIAVMSILPTYQAKRLDYIVWLLVPATLLVMEVIRLMKASGYERFRRKAIMKGSHIYMVRSLRLNESRNAWMVLLQDEQRHNSQQSIWGDVKLGDYIVLGDGMEVEDRMPYLNAECWSDVLGSSWISGMLTSPHVFDR
jgi:hypothetical protein